MSRRSCPGRNDLPLFRRDCEACGEGGFFLTREVAQRNPDARCPSCAGPLSREIHVECAECRADGAHRRAA